MTPHDNIVIVKGMYVMTKMSERDVSRRLALIIVCLNRIKFSGFLTLVPALLML